MAHELSIRENGFVETAYVGEVGWHGLGQKLEEGASIEEWTKAAGMDWRIQRSAVRFATNRPAPDQDPATFPPSYATMPDRHVLMRSDTKAPLSVVSDSFKVVQPKAVLEFFRDLAGDNGFSLNTAGVLFAGRRFWALASIGEEANVGAGDKIKGYLLLSTSCDGSMATEGRFTSVRVVCNNTLSMATGGKAKSRVTHRSVFDPTKMKKELGIEAKEQFADFMNSMRDLAAKPLANSEVIEMTAELFHPGSAKKSREDYIQALKTRSVANVLELAIDGSAKGSKLPGVKDTAYGLLNAVTEYIDHHKQARSDDNRRASAWFGPGETLKSRALEMALAA